METIYCIVIYRGVNRSRQTQADVMSWVKNKSNTLLLRAQTRGKE
jgi:hypothetical protein